VTETYQYPDTGDQLIFSFSAMKEPYPGYWDTSEEGALRRAADRVAQLVPPREQARALDAGCGWGRLIPWAARFAHDVTAADADRRRLALAREREIPAGTEVRFQHAPITEITGGPFDVIVCSHVVQHVPTGMVRPILQRLGELSNPGALLVLSFSRAPVGSESYGLACLDQDDAHTIRTVDRPAYDEAATRSDSRFLPVRFIDPETLAADAVATGWQRRWDWVYHAIDDLGIIDAYTDRDEMMNDVPSLRRYLGTDMMTVWQRSS
jgi:SAM-dependent methyltransferase